MLFAIGSVCFMVGAFPGFVQLVGSAADGTVFFVGSVFFTSAALIQYLEAANADRDLAGGGGADAPVSRSSRTGSTGGRRGSSSSGRCSSTSTPSARCSRASTPPQVDRLVWAPEAVGSICFLISGLLAYLEVRDGGIFSAKRTLEWKISTVNFAGCILFGISAIAGVHRPRNR